MHGSQHRFHIPVMGTGFTVDTPIRLGRFGISSAISLVDDILLERIRRHYSQVFDLPFRPVTGKGAEARARRITAYLDTVDVIVRLQTEKLRSLPFLPGNEKWRYFELLPASSPLKELFRKRLESANPAERERLEEALSAGIEPGSIDCNIMTKLDRIPPPGNGQAPDPADSDAKSALRGFAQSGVRGSIVFSAGINPTLYGCLEAFPDFYREAGCEPLKGVVLKVSDFRSAVTQGRYLARKGIEVREFRIEAGLNCGGHAFGSEGLQLGAILEEFKEKREEFPDLFEPLIQAYYRKAGRHYPEDARGRRISITVQGGIGCHGELRRLTEYYGMDGTGWGSPFLLVPEATALDDMTRDRLAQAGEDDIYLSDVSPLGVAFQNLRGSTSDAWMHRRAAAGRSGSPCPKGFLNLNMEFGRPLCTASAEYQAAKLRSMGYDSPPPPDSPDPRVRELFAKACICDHLGNGALIQLGIGSSNLPVAVCPGPNLAYFGRRYALEEMVDHIYGRGPSLVPQDRPHMFAKELEISVDYFSRLAEKAPGTHECFPRLETYRRNLLEGMEYYRTLTAKLEAFPGENLSSLRQAVEVQAERLEAVWAGIPH